MKAPRPILLLEINEIPWRVIDSFRQNYKNIDRFFARARNHTTETVDEGELSPWITWPTIHRGLPSREHKVMFLGQDPASFRGVPIWEEYLNAGYDVGVCGSLQSWPPRDPGPKGFYVPDTFAQSPACFPKYIEPFQELNLQLVNENGRIVSSKIPISKSLLRTALALPKLGIRARTLLRITKQLALERLRPAYLARRPLFQAELLWDIFRSHYRAEDPPAFSSFFTNHVAGIMHRYWQDIFPADFGTDRRDPRYFSAMLEAMRILDEILGDVLTFQERNPKLIVVLASSMGQAATKWARFEGHSTLLLRPMDLVRSLANDWPGIEAEKIDELPAMVPQTALKVQNTPLMENLRDRLHQCFTAGGEPLFFASLDGDRLSLSLRTPSSADVAAGGFHFRGQGSARFIKWEEAGIKTESVSPASAYHIPEGVLAVLDAELAPENSRKVMKADSVKQLLLGMSGIRGREANV